jgi:hypothetical protein
MAGFKEIMKLQPWLKPGHKHQQGNPDRGKDNPHKVGAKNPNELRGQLVLRLWF